MASRRGRLLVLSALLLGAGIATAATALSTYFTRYSRVDALFGEIDSVLYTRLTQMASVEKVALVLGGSLVVSALLVACIGLLRRLASQS